ncbi:uncharacterized protein ATNIH1004_006375 [Aspergillus tanneri]|uniref:F-box domain-containing protein n=1 Tax=Aspergillus tanneri TaxID=1220188 RepID=A0A5M9MKZ4_9EURO|nr:uncharacterized protein ATNIH1004_006375 [Aspergillus tanneri]KAA8647681.1 hypothetical protein ATNIH1004_006375 [Aspergillus tanneri]
MLHRRMTLKVPNMMSGSPLECLPTEVIVSIFTALPSFSDVAWFAATGRRFHRVWTENAYSIYQQIAPRTVPCRRHARILLADQGGPHPNAANLSFPHVLRLIQNAAILERSAEDFNKHHRERVQGTDLLLHSAPLELPPFPQHRPCLSRSERPRFIRGLYQLWSLVLLSNPEKRQQRIRQMKLKDLWVVRDLIVGDVVRIPAPIFLAMQDPGVAFEQVHLDLLPWLEQMLDDLYGEPIGRWCQPFSEGLNGCISIWDSYYNEFKDMVLRGFLDKKPHPDPETVWDDTSDEDQVE